MRFWRRKKKKEKKQLTDQQIEQIVKEYMGLTKSIIGNYLPRRMRRALNKKSKGWEGLSSSEKKGQIEEVKQQGLSSWLDQSTQEAFEQVASYTTDSVALEEELRKQLREFKKKWNIK